MVFQQNTIIYHQIKASDWRGAKQHGLISTSRGAKGDDSLIQQADIFLDRHIPRSLKDARVSRDNNLYGYLGDSETIIDIDTGKPCSLVQKASEEGQILLQLKVDPAKCWVSNLDLYDRVKKTLANGTSAEHVALHYWASLQRLDRYDFTIPRPEVMIIYDISPAHFKKFECKK